MKDEARTRVLLSVQVALLGEVFPGLDSVGVSWDTESIKLSFFLSMPLSEEDQLSISSIEAEMAAHFPDKEILSEWRVSDRDNVSPGMTYVFARRPLG